MSSEIQVYAGLSCKNGNFTFPRVGDLPAFVNQSAVGGAVPGFQVIGTSAETVSTTDLATPGWCYAKNLDSTNYVELGPDSSGFVPFIKLKPGEQTVFRLASGVTFKAKANTAAVKLQIYVFED